MLFDQVAVTPGVMSQTYTVTNTWRAGPNDTLDNSEEEENPLYTTANADTSGVETVIDVEEVGSDHEADRIVQNLETLEIAPNPNEENVSEPVAGRSGPRNTPLRPATLNLRPALNEDMAIGQNSIPPDNGVRCECVQPCNCPPTMRLREPFSINDVPLGHEAVVPVEVRCGCDQPCSCPVRNTQMGLHVIAPTGYTLPALGTQSI